jgi:hypothetical protein
MTFDPGEVSPPADQFAVGRRSMRSTRPKENDRLQQARLAGRVGSDDEVGAGAERGVKRAVSAQVLRG